MLHDFQLFTNYGVRVMQTGNKKNFTSSFATCVPYISFPCCIALLRTTQQYCIGTLKADFLVSFPILGGKAFNLSSLSTMLAVNFIGFTQLIAPPFHKSCFHLSLTTCRFLSNISSRSPWFIKCTFYFVTPLLFSFSSTFKSI